MNIDCRLQARLASWQDWDIAAFEIAVALGILPFDVFLPEEAKHVFWRSNRLGDAVSEILTILVRIGALEHDEEEQRYRWHAGFAWRAFSAIVGR